MYIGKFKSCVCVRSSADIPVQNGLCLTPTEMMSMASRGVPISVSNEHNFYDGEENPSWVIDPIKERGVDAADLWQLQMSARKKIRNAKRIESNE